MSLETILSGGLAGSLVAFLLNNWLAVRLKSEIESEYNRKLDEFRSELRNAERLRDNRWDLKRDTCLEALTLVDAVFSNRPWVKNGVPIEMVKQPIDTIKAREIMNRLALVCETDLVLKEFISTLGLQGPDEPAITITADKINAFRNAIRKELGFGNELQLDPALAFIARLGPIVAT